MKKELINPPGTERTYEAWKFSQAVKAGNIIWVSGQVGYGPDGVPDDISEQARIALNNLKAVLEHAGAKLTDVVETVVYLTDMADSKAFAAVKSEFFTSDYAASTVVGVTGLALPTLKVEVRATAVICD